MPLKWWRNGGLEPRLSAQEEVCAMSRCSGEPGRPFRLREGSNGRAIFREAPRRALRKHRRARVREARLARDRRAPTWDSLHHLRRVTDPIRRRDGSFPGAAAREHLALNMRKRSYVRGDDLMLPETPATSSIE